ncbi:hypothetical protein JST97_14490 [bacterium]|nr:hypothetical protein [bacterium]
MICHKCKTPVTAGDRCPACGTTLAMLVPPPAEFNKKDDLYQKTLELRAGQVTEAVVSAYLEEELGKIEVARGKLREGDAPVLLEGLDLWQKALEQARTWLASKSDFDVQAALNLATQADHCINRSIQEHFEANRDMVRNFQAEARLRENPPPELPEDGLLIGFKLGNDPK